MTACDVHIGASTLTLEETPLPDGRVTGSGQIKFDKDVFTVSTEEISLEGGERLHKIWGPRVVRISLATGDLGTEAGWNVLINR